MKILRNRFPSTQRCRVLVIELDLYVWAYLHIDTVCVLSLGLLVDRAGFTYVWKPGKAPELILGKLRVSCYPHFNVPFIYSSHARGNPFACPSSPPSPSFANIVQDEMKGLEDLIPETVPPVPSLGGSKEGDARGNPLQRPPRRRQCG